MSQLPISGAFQSAQVGGPGPTRLNIEESPVAPGWSPGATIARTLQVQPALTERFALVAWTIVLNGTLSLSSSFPNNNGRLGNLIAGVFPGSQTTGTTNPWAAPMLPLPENSSSLQIIWDGASDPTFPNALNPNLTPLEVSFNPPTPIALASGEQASIGIWLTPSLIGPNTSLSLNVWNARYTVIYDDGKPPVAGWGGE